MGYQFELVNQTNFIKYQNFSFPRYRNAFSESTAQERYFGIGVCDEGTPVGLILGKQNRNYPQNMVIVSIFVIEEYRRKSIATGLFKQFEMELKNQGYQCLELWCIDNRESIEYLARILAKSGWKPLETCDYIYKCRIADFNHPWIEKFQLKKGFSICNLNELTELEKADLKKGCNIWYPESLSPFAEEERLNPELTLFLKHQGAIIGWCSIFQATAETVTYRSLFVKKEFQGTGAMIPLLARVTQAHLKEVERYPYLAFQVALENTKVINIIKKSMANDFLSITRRILSYKYI